jgi:hypothetical protein
MPCNTHEYVALVTVRGRAQSPLIWRQSGSKTPPHQHRMCPSLCLQMSKPAKSAGSSGSREPDAAACVRCGDVAVHSVRHISRPDGSCRQNTLYCLFRKILHQQRLCQICCKAIVIGCGGLGKRSLGHEDDGAVVRQAKADHNSNSDSPLPKLPG